MSCEGDSSGSGCCDGHSHLDASTDQSTRYCLHQMIDTENLQCLNESTPGSCKLVFRPWSQRLTVDSCVESDCDEELLFNVPFTGVVRLKGIVLIGGEGDCRPTKLRLFRNREFMTFDEAGAEADQEVDLCPDPQGLIEYSLKPTKFGSVSHLSIHVSANAGGDTSRVHYIGLRGDFIEPFRSKVVIANYEVRPQAADHPAESDSVESAFNQTAASK